MFGYKAARRDRDRIFSCGAHFIAQSFTQQGANQEMKEAKRN